MDQVVKAILVLLVAFILQYVYQCYKASKLSDTLLDGVEDPEGLNEHSREFDEPEVLQVIPGIWVAIGYALANSIMIEAPDGLIIVDTTEGLESGHAVYEAFRHIHPSKPITTIMYTHNHVDHVFGASAFADNPDSPPDVWAHHSINEEIQKVYYCGPQIYKRAMRQFGTFVPVINAGLGPRLQFDTIEQTTGFITPTHFLTEEEEDVTISGLNMTLMHIPGETADHLGIFIPSKDVFLCGDDIYKAFPNLYAIRGTPPRDNMKWVNSLDKIRELEPNTLIPSHTRPIVGREKVYDTLTIYRDGIQYVHDQTVRLMNKGMHPVDIAKTIRLPPQLESHDYLKPFYGTVEWSSKGVFSNYMGWFSGDPVDLSPFSPTEKAERMIELGNGREQTLVQARQALENGEYQWALELSSYVFRLDESDHEAIEIRTQAMKQLAGTQTSANGRNYYLTTILEDHDLINLVQRPGHMIHRTPLEWIFNVMGTRLKTEVCGDIHQRVLFNFTDIEEAFLLVIRHGILETTTEDYHTELDDIDIRVTITSSTWKKLVAKQINPVWAYLTGSISIEPGIIVFKRFMDCFETDV